MWQSSRVLRDRRWRMGGCGGSPMAFVAHHSTGGRRAPPVPVVPWIVRPGQAGAHRNGNAFCQGRRKELAKRFTAHCLCPSFHASVLRCDYGGALWQGVCFNCRLVENYPPVIARQELVTRAGSALPAGGRGSRREGKRRRSGVMCLGVLGRWPVRKGGGT
jgi:hypothetical protein